jgi:hypothetical protein
MAIAIAVTIIGDSRQFLSWYSFSLLLTRALGRNIGTTLSIQTLPATSSRSICIFALKSQQAHKTKIWTCHQLMQATCPLGSNRYNRLAAYITSVIKVLLAFAT